MLDDPSPLNHDMLTMILRASAEDAAQMLKLFGRGPFGDMLILADWLEENGDSWRGGYVRRKVHESKSTQLTFLRRVSDAPGLPAHALADIMQAFPEVCICEPIVKPKVCRITDKSWMESRDKEDILIRLFREAGIACATDRGYAMIAGPAVTYYRDIVTRQHVYTQAGWHTEKWCPQRVPIGIDNESLFLPASSLTVPLT